MKFHVITYGCQMNERDSEAVSALLRRHGHVWTDREEDADLVIVNTCSVRAKAEEKALGKLGLLAAARREGGPRRIIAVGCLAERQGAGLLDRAPGVDAVVGPRRLAGLADIVAEIEAGRGPLVATGGTAGADTLLADRMPGPVSVFVTVMAGCDGSCTYCVVPRVRGREWSRLAADVLEEVRRAVAMGAREITFLGQTVTAYGRSNPVWDDHAPPSPLGFTQPLPRLLEAAAAIPGVRRLRFESSHPMGCTDELARALKELPSLCEHVHLPCQSGSDRILRRMARGYTTDDYRRAVERLRAAVPGVALTTDVIVGFPSETEEDFERTSRFLDEIGFDNAFIFKYSPRPGTPAEAWPDDVPAAEKRRRNARLLEEQNRRSLHMNRRMEHSVVEVLAEGPSARRPARWTGRTRTNRIVLFDPTPEVRPGDLVCVRITEARPQTLHGVIETGSRA